MNYTGYIANRKKILIPLLVVVVLIVGFVSVMAFYLDKINYDDGSQAPKVVYTAGDSSTVPQQGNNTPDAPDVPGAETTIASANSNGAEPSIPATTAPSKSNDDFDISHLQLSSEQQAQLSQADQSIQLNDSEIWSSKDVINIVLAGIDNGSPTYPYGRSDAMILVSINKATQRVRLISLSRAAYVYIPGVNVNTRLSHAHGYGGAGTMISTIEQNYKISIDNYISTTFTAFEKIVDIIGGANIELTAAEAEALESKIKAAELDYIGAGTYQLNGRLALEYARLRKIDSDKNRTERQRKLLTSLTGSIKSMGFNQARTILDEVLPLVTTDLSKTEIIQYGITAFSKYLNWPMEQYSLPHKSSALQLIDNFEVILVDWPSEVEFAHSLIYGGVGTDSIKYQ